MEQLKAGDAVRLISGGPVMTLERFSTNGGDAICVWFSEIAYTETGRIMYAAGVSQAPLNVESLVKVEPQ